VQWKIHGERRLYSSPWVNLCLVDVELPNGSRFDHHVVRVPRPAVGVVVTRDDEVLLLWRHRFITNTWGWEIPAGMVDDGEMVEDAGRREVMEETGWSVDTLSTIGVYQPSNGLSDQKFHLLKGEGTTFVETPRDNFEAERVEWVAWPDVHAAISEGTLQDGLSLTALLWATHRAG
jgi:8-oxo-dGTP pyrophosphatase MutT (NUDIX family)